MPHPKHDLEDIWSRSPNNIFLCASVSKPKDCLMTTLNPYPMLPNTSTFGEVNRNISLNHNIHVNISIISIINVINVIRNICFPQKRNPYRTTEG